MSEKFKTSINQNLKDERSQFKDCVLRSTTAFLRDSHLLNYYLSNHYEDEIIMNHFLQLKTCNNFRNLCIIPLPIVLLDCL